MNTKPLLLRVAAVGCSLLLLGGYVYEQAVGGLLPKWGPARLAGESLLPGSKVKTLQLAPGHASSQILPGSKSAMVAEPFTLSPNDKHLEATETQILPSTTDSTTLLPGSKSTIIINPAPPTPVKTSGNEANITLQPGKLVPSKLIDSELTDLAPPPEAPPEPAAPPSKGSGHLLPGPKSAPVFQTESAPIKKQPASPPAQRPP